MHFFQNAVPTVLTFSTISKLHKFKINVSVKKATFENKKYVFQYRISPIEKPSEIQFMLNCLR